MVTKLDMDKQPVVNGFYSDWFRNCMSDIENFRYPYTGSVVEP
jgi:hypothetical protein